MQSNLPVHGDNTPTLQTNGQTEN